MNRLAPEERFGLSVTAVGILLVSSGALLSGSPEWALSAVTGGMLGLLVRVGYLLWRGGGEP